MWEDYGAGQGKVDLSNDLRQQNPSPGHFRRGKKTGARKQAQGFPSQAVTETEQRENSGAS